MNDKEIIETLKNRMKTLSDAYLEVTKILEEIKNEHPEYVRSKLNIRSYDEIMKQNN